MRLAFSGSSVTIELDNGSQHLEKGTAYYDPERVPRPGKFYLPVQCHQCDNPPCVRACHSKHRNFSCSCATAFWLHDNAQRQADQFICSGRNCGQVEPFDEPDPCAEEDMMGLDAIVHIPADREIVNTDRAHLPVDEELRGRRTDIDEILDNGGVILEPEIVDSLLTVESDLLLIGQSKGKFGGGQRRIFSAKSTIARSSILSVSRYVNRSSGKSGSRPIRIDFRRSRYRPNPPAT